MALVDYSSDSESEAEQKPEEKEPCPTAKDRPPLPPLPPSFHDLYASTVRTSARDDPSLHQGRTRQIPHVAGNWPSHIYVEWFPTQDECATLSSLLEELRSELADEPAGGGQQLHSFLTSDLGTPLPLHISLSRPFVLTTEEKDGFLRRLTAAIEGQTAISRFAVHPSALSWHRSPDSNRAFLVLRVLEGDSGNNDGNPSLAALLAKCNALVRQFGQPPLYASSHSSDGDDAAAADDKFHVSVAWSFADVTEELRARTAAVYGRRGFLDQVGALRIPVECVKVKIGNVVSSLALSGGHVRRPAKENLFGI
ncbi:hypothetical protein MAPG_07566 [Magnaporthiopsis poae ATCC 64411]|uniref:U6 snRNA phosphodiesterase n=1 Tax=Magnaporthiopsis poae (strain ATCC 64411 / 73-15) TaxID=644358 RepID=A0A0C4E507_MAGP6|nr:hypothetical protein MAPG_07566 [Magnaporthiopsis poae ATCC 64411]